jgi:tRNA G26 N,N-dimethylase Trm1
MDTAMKTSNKKTPNINREEKELSNDIQTKITRYVNRIAEGNLSLITEQIIDEIFVSSTHSVVKNKSLLNHKLSLISKSFATQIVLNAIENTCSTPSLVASQTAVVIVLTVRLGYTVRFFLFSSDTIRNNLSPQNFLTL